MISSPLMDDAYQRLVPPYDGIPEIAPSPLLIPIDV
jgi:hypothetical protein